MRWSAFSTKTWELAYRSSQTRANRIRSRQITITRWSVNNIDDLPYQTWDRLRQSKASCLQVRKNTSPLHSAPKLEKLPIGQATRVQIASGAGKLQLLGDQWRKYMICLARIENGFLQVRIQHAFSTKTSDLANWPSQTSANRIRSRQITITRWSVKKIDDLPCQNWERLPQSQEKHKSFAFSTKTSDLADWPSQTVGTIVILASWMDKLFDGRWKRS